LTLTSISNSLGTLLDRRAMPDELAKGGSMDCARWLGVIFLVCGLAGCAGTGIKSNEEADAKIAVAKKAKSRWDALIKGDLAAAYEYLSPGRVVCCRWRHIRRRSGQGCGRG